MSTLRAWVVAAALAACASNRAPPRARVVEPVADWPRLDRPQHRAPPDISRAQVKSAPATTSAASVMPATG